jgi:hypothetical protein
MVLKDCFECIAHPIALFFLAARRPLAVYIGARNGALLHENGWLVNAALPGRQSIQSSGASTRHKRRMQIACEPCFTPGDRPFVIGYAGPDAPVKPRLHFCRKPVLTLWHTLHKAPPRWT